MAFILAEDRPMREQSKCTWLCQNAVNECIFVISSVVKITLSCASNTNVMEVTRFSEEFLLLLKTEQMYLLPPPLQWCVAARN